MRLFFKLLWFYGENGVGTQLGRPHCPVFLYFKSPHFLFLRVTAHEFVVLQVQKVREGNFEYEKISEDFVDWWRIFFLSTTTRTKPATIFNNIPHWDLDTIRESLFSFFSRYNSRHVGYFQIPIYFILRLHFHKKFLQMFQEFGFRPIWKMIWLANCKIPFKSLCFV